MKGRAVDIVGFRHDPNNGCVTSIQCSGGEFPIESWGCEFGNWYGFFSQAKCGGLHAEVTNKGVSASPGNLRAGFDVALPHGRFRFEGREFIEGGAIRRQYQLLALEDSLLGDFVIRTALSASQWPVASIGDTDRRHRDKNAMTQVPQRTARLSGPWWRLTSTLTAVEGSNQLSVLTYVRDAKDGQWIVHHRLLTQDSQCDEYVFTFWNFIRSSQESPWAGNRLLRWIFWRLAERVPFIRPTLQIGGNIRFLSGARLTMEASLTLESLS